MLEKSKVQPEYNVVATLSQQDATRYITTATNYLQNELKNPVSEIPKIVYFISVFLMVLIYSTVPPLFGIETTGLLVIALTGAASFISATFLSVTMFSLYEKMMGIETGVGPRVIKIVQDLVNAECWAKQQSNTAVTTYQSRLAEIDNHHEQQQKEL